MPESRIDTRDVLSYDAFPDYDTLYCDPPWEQRMVRFFETQAHKQAGLERPENSIHDILRHVARLHPPDRPAFVEYSVTGVGEVVGAFVEHGHKHTGTHVLQQAQNDAPYALVTFNRRLPAIPAETRGWGHLPHFLRPGEVVFDPFAGIGATARAVVAFGATYLGSELNPARAERARAELQRALARAERARRAAAATDHPADR